MSDERANETKPMMRVQSRLGRPLRDYLRERYESDGLTTTEIASELSVTPNTVQRWMRRLDIELRFPGQRGKAL